MALAKTAYQRYCQSHYFKCDDSWAYGHGGSSGITIFHINKNYGYGGYGGYGGCCNGGSFWSGFGKGLGWGFAQGIMNFLSCGFGLFGGGFGGGFNWGDVFGSKKAKETEKPKTEKETEKPEKDADYKKLNDFHEKLNKAKSSDYDTLNKELNELEKVLDDPSKPDNKKQVDNLRTQLNKLKTDTSDPTKPTDTSQTNDISVNKQKDDVDPNDVNCLNDINKLTPEQIKELSKENAVAILEKLDIKEGSELPFNCARNLKVLQILEKSEINVKLGYNKATNPEYKVIDHYICGKIKLDKNASESNIKYTIDCSEKGAQGNTYDVEATKNDKNNDILKVTLKQGGKKDNNKTANIDPKSVDPIIYEAPAKGSNIKCAYRDGRRYTTTTTTA